MENKSINEFDEFLQSVERNELSEEQQILLSSFGGDLTVVHNDSPNCSCNVNNCHDGNCVSGCGNS